MKKLFLMLAFVLSLNSVAYAYSTSSITKVQHLKDGSSLANASFEIAPHSEVETGSSIIISFDKAVVFSQEILDGTSSDKDEVGYKEGGYQYNENGVTWNGKDGFFDVVSKTNTSKLPYYLRRLNDYQLQVFLINLPNMYVDSSLSEVNGSSRNPYYSIPLVAYADVNGNGEVTMSVDSNGSSISSWNSGSVNNSLATETTTDKTTETTTEATTEETKTNGSELENKVIVQIGSNDICVNGQKVKIDHPAYIQTSSSSTMIPLRAVSQGVIGNEECVSYDANTKTAIIKFENKELRFQTGSNTAYINGKAVNMPNGVKAEIKNSRMFVPYRFLGEALGAKVSWNAEDKVAYFN